MWQGKKKAVTFSFDDGVTQDIRLIEILNKYGLKCVSVHQGPQPFVAEGEAIVDFLAELGVKYCVIPWYERAKLAYGTPVWDETIALFKKYSEAKL